MMNSFEQKEQKLQDLLDQHGLQALLLQSVASFAWATNGAASYVNTATSKGEAALLFTPDERYLITNNIEAPRLADEAGLKSQGWIFKTSPWHEQSEVIAALTADLRLGADGAYPNATDLSHPISRLRASLTAAEGERFRQLGQLCAQAMAEAIHAVQPGMSEYEIAALLANATTVRGAQPIVNLIATDERVFRFRHPLPTARNLERYAMLVLCGRRDGLVCSITRLIHFGLMPDELRQKAEAVAAVDAAFIHATRPGRRLSDIFQKGVAAYEATGYADEWQHHHQGGPAGYEPREFVVTPQTSDFVTQGQVYAWNPSIAGTKSEDTILIGEEENEIITAIPGWPTVSVTVEGKEWQRPAILEFT